MSDPPDGWPPPKSPRRQVEEDIGAQADLALSLHNIARSILKPELTGPRNRVELLLSFIVIAGSFFYLWRLSLWAPWTIVFLFPFVILLWRAQKQTLFSLGLKFPEFICSLQRWRILWVPVLAVFLVVRWRGFFQPRTLFLGSLYLIWCAVQQVVYQSAVYSVFKANIRSRWAAVCLSALVFAGIHAPNPVLVPACLIWGAVSNLLFDNCRSALGLAVMQVLLSSTLASLTPSAVHHGFRVGPWYDRVPYSSVAPAETFAGNIPFLAGVL